MDYCEQEEIYRICGDREFWNGFSNWIGCIAVGFNGICYMIYQLIL